MLSLLSRAFNLVVLLAPGRGVETLKYVSGLPQTPPALHDGLVDQVPLSGRKQGKSKAKETNDSEAAPAAEIPTPKLPPTLVVKNKKSETKKQKNEAVEEAANKRKTSSKPPPPEGCTSTKSAPPIKRSDMTKKQRSAQNNQKRKPLS